MPKPGLSISRILANDAVDSRRIDENLKKLFSTVNGGLTASNLAPGLKLSESYFREFHSIYALTGEPISSTTDRILGYTLNTAGLHFLVAVSVALPLNTAEPTVNERTFNIKTAGTTRYTFVLPENNWFTISGTKYYTGVVYPDYRVSFAANTLITFNRGTGTVAGGNITAWMAAPHQGF